MSLLSDFRSVLLTARPAVAAAFFAIAISSASAATATLTVTVKDQKGNPIVDANVNLYYPMSLVPNRVRDIFPSDRQDRTNAQGLVVFEKLEAGKIILEVARENFVAHREEFVPDASGRKNVVLSARSKAGEKLEETTTIEVTVVHKDGSAVESATVRVILQGTFLKDHYGQTDSKGVAMIVTPLHNEFEIIASKPLLGEKRATLRSKDYPKVTAPQVLTLERPPGTEVTITVFDQETKGFIGDASVILDGPSYHPGTTDNTGRVSFFVTGTGTYAVRISQQFYEPLTGEVKVGGTDKKSESFPLTAKTKKTVEGTNSVEVTVLQADKTDRISGSNLALPNALVTVGPSTAGTNSSGIAKISGDFEGTVQVTVKADGYKPQTKTVRFSEGGRFTGSKSSVTFLMQRDSTDDVIEVTVFAKTKDKSGPLASASVAVAGENKTTDANGRAKFTGEFEGIVEVAVEKEGYLRQVKNVNTSGGKASATFTLQPAPDEDSVAVTVTGADPKGGSATAISGAVVSANGLTATTNKDGRATISGQFKDSVEVGVQAKGFIAQTQQVSITKPARTGTANFILQAEALPIVLIVEVQDPGKKGVSGADVDFYTGSGALLFGEAALTNAAGKTTFNSKENSPAQDVSVLRQGMKVTVKRTGFRDHESLVHADLLKPAKENNYLVQLDRDWTELENALTALEAKVAAWNADRNAGPSKDQESAFIEKALKARKRAEELYNEIDAAKATFHIAIAPGMAAEWCKTAKKLQEEIRKCDADAKQKTTEQKRLIDDAGKQAETCSTNAHVEQIRSSYRSAIKLLGEIGSINKKAVGHRDALMQQAKESQAMKTALADLQNKAGAIAEQSKIADEAVKGATEQNGRFANLRKTIATRLVALKAEFAVITVKYEKERQEMPGALRSRFDKIQSALDTKSTVDLSSEPGKIPESVTSAPAAIENFRTKAEKALSHYRAATCEIDDMHEIVNGLNETLTNASFEIGLAADLPGRADACAAKVAAAGASPTPVIDEITVPDVSGYADPGAMKAAAGPNMVGVIMATKATPPPGTTKLFASQDPPANSKAKRGSTLKIYIYQSLAAASSPTPTPIPSPIPTPTPSPSAGDEVTVPDVSGFNDPKAMKAAAGPDMVGMILATKNTPPAGSTKLFASQDPPANTKAKRGSTLKIYIYQSLAAAASPTPTSPTSTTAGMPNLIGLTLDQAVTRLKPNMRINSDEIGDKPPTPEQALTIFSQDPAAGTNVDASKPIVVTVKRYGSAKAAPAGKERFDGRYVGSYSGSDSGTVRFTVNGGTIAITSPGSGTGQISSSGSASISGSGADGASSYTFSGMFSVDANGKATAGGRWTGTQSGFTGRGTWSAGRR